MDADSWVTKVASWFVEDMEVLYGSANLANANAVEVSFRAVLEIGTHCTIG